MSNRTDLALECLEFVGETIPKGVERSFEMIKGRKITRVVVTDEKAINKAVGEYLTVESEDFRSTSYDFCTEVSILSSLLIRLVGDSKKVLVVGLGNNNITPDALGPKAMTYIFVTSHIDPLLGKQIGLENLSSVSAIAPGVFGQTGIESSTVVKSLVAEIHPDCVIVVDALAAKNVNRLAKTVQLSTAGIAPGSGVQNRRVELSEKTLGVPVISVGIPMVVDMATIARDVSKTEDINVSNKDEEMFVTPREIDLVVEHAAKTVAFAINKALNPSISLEDFSILVG